MHYAALVPNLIIKLYVADNLFVVKIGQVYIQGKCQPTTCFLIYCGCDTLYSLVCFFR